jgi:hypothetical protein
MRWTVIDALYVPFIALLSIISVCVISIWVLGKYPRAQWVAKTTAAAASSMISIGYAVSGAPVMAALYAASAAIWVLIMLPLTTSPTIDFSDEFHHDCPHPMDPHAMIPTDGDPMHGGIMLCPEPGCECFSTWSGGGSTRPVIVPDPDYIADLRKGLQQG